MGIYIDAEFPRRCLECPMYIDEIQCCTLGTSVMS